MEYLTFQKKITAEVASRLAEADPSFLVESREVRKPSGSGRSIVLRPPGSNVMVSLSLRQLYDQLPGPGKGDPEAAIGKIADGAADALLRGLQDLPQINTEDFRDYEKLKSQLLLQLIPQENNQELLQKTPHRKILDMALICRLKTQTDDGWEGTAIIDRAFLDLFGVEEETLFADAKQNAPRLEPPSLLTLEEMLSSLVAHPYTPEVPSRIYVATVKSRLFGAAVIAYPGFLKSAADLLEGGFYMIPSSVHEMLLLPDSSAPETAVLESMLQEINAREVPPEERLSERVFHYDPAEDQLAFGMEHSARRMALRGSEAERAAGRPAAGMPS